MKQYLMLFSLMFILTLAGCHRIDFDDLTPMTTSPENDYKLIKKFTASDGAMNDNFGRVVALSGDGKTILVGTTEDNDFGARSGSAYIYRRDSISNQWTEKKLLASDEAAGDVFGISASFSTDGNILLIGACGDDGVGDWDGAAYIYKWNSNSQQWDEHKLISSDRKGGDQFGWRVSLSKDGNTALISSPSADDKGTDSGAVYIFRWNSFTGNWNEKKLVASDGAADDNLGLGISLSKDGDTILAGVKYEDDNGTDSGSAYIFHWNAFTGAWDEKKLVASDGAAGDYFGNYVALSGNGETALIGAYADDDLSGTDTGSAYIYRLDKSTGQWEEKKLVASDRTAGAVFGWGVSLSIDGNVALIGAWVDNEKGAYAGSAYFYRWNEAAKLWEEKKLIASDVVAHDSFGFAVSLADDGNTALIGSYRDDDKGTDSGSAYLYSYE